MNASTVQADSIHHAIASRSHDTVECVLRKRDKRYSISPVGLIVHEAFTPLDDVWAWDESVLDTAMQEAAGKTMFSMIWLVDFTNRRYRTYVAGINAD